MPFRSEKQRRYLAADKPGIFKEWTKKSGSKINVAIEDDKGKVVKLFKESVEQ